MAGRVVEWVFIFYLEYRLRFIIHLFISSWRLALFGELLSWMWASEYASDRVTVWPRCAWPEQSAELSFVLIRVRGRQSQLLFPCIFTEGACWLLSFLSSVFCCCCFFVKETCSWVSQYLWPWSRLIVKTVTRTRVELPHRASDTKSQMLLVCHAVTPHISLSSIFFLLYTGPSCLVSSVLPVPLPSISRSTPFSNWRIVKSCHNKGRLVSNGQTGSLLNCTGESGSTGLAWMSF